MEKNNDALTQGEEAPYKCPHDITLDEINQLRKCPEMFQITRYFSFLEKELKDEKYLDIVDLEMLSLDLDALSFAGSHEDPIFDPDLDFRDAELRFNQPFPRMFHAGRT